MAYLFDPEESPVLPAAEPGSGRALAAPISRPVPRDGRRSRPLGAALLLLAAATAVAARVLAVHAPPARVTAVLATLARLCSRTGSAVRGRSEARKQPSLAFDCRTARAHWRDAATRPARLETSARSVSTSSPPWASSCQSGEFAIVFAKLRVVLMLFEASPHNHSPAKLASHVVRMGLVQRRLRCSRVASRPRALASFHRSGRRARSLLFGLSSGWIRRLRRAPLLARGYRRPRWATGPASGLSKAGRAAAFAMLAVGPLCGSVSLDWSSLRRRLRRRLLFRPFLNTRRSSHFITQSCAQKASSVREATRPNQQRRTRPGMRGRRPGSGPQTAPPSKQLPAGGRCASRRGRRPGSRRRLRPRSRPPAKEKNLEPNGCRRQATTDKLAWHQQLNAKRTDLFLILHP